MNRILNVTGTLLSKGNAVSNNGGLSEIQVKLDNDKSQEATTIQIDSQTYVHETLTVGDRVRIIISCEDENPIPAIVETEEFEDFFCGDTKKLNSFRSCDRPMQRSIMARHLGSHFDKAESTPFRIKDYEQARIYYTLTQNTYSNNQQTVIASWLDHYNRGENARRLEIMFGISQVNNSRRKRFSTGELRDALDKEFVGMKRAKEQLVQTIISNQYSGAQGFALCFVGPPGTGKSAVAETYAKLLQQPYSIIPCAGLTYAIDIAGDRPVFNGATVGRVVEEAYKIGTTDAVFIFDEFDKMPKVEDMGKDGNPYNAFLELFAQKQITDNYLGTEVSFARTTFICTCNCLDNIPVAVRNRMSIIDFDPYSDDELLEISRTHITPKILGEKRVPDGAIEFTQAASQAVLQYIDDFGARRTEEHIRDIIDSIITDWSKGTGAKHTKITSDDVDHILSRKVDRHNIRAEFRRHLASYSKAVVEKVIDIIGKLDNPYLESKLRFVLQQQLEFFVKLRPNTEPFSFDADRFNQLVNGAFYGQERVKKTFASFFYEISVNPTPANRRLLLVGPPGVGKSGIVQAAAVAAGLPYVKVSMSGIDDPKVLRGFSPTYLGAQAGKFVRETAKANTTRVVIHIDELDKIADARAQEVLLTLLDDSGMFEDDFLEGIPVDFKSAIFIATGNDLNMHPALLSRFTVLHLNAYTRRQQHEILKRHLIPNACQGYKSEIEMSEDAVMALMQYEQSGGVRGLKEKTEQVVRQIVCSQQNEARITIRKEDVFRVLGPTPPERGNRPSKNNRPGIANGLAVTGAGKGICFAIESRMLPGNGVEITGLPSEVILDSVKLSMSLLAIDYGVDFSGRKLCVHFAEGAVKKDGPSAGTSILVSILSAALDQVANPNTCFTGEIDLFGNVWAVGGVLEKINAAYEAGLETVFIPSQCFQRLSDEERIEIDSMDISVLPVSHVSQIIEKLFPKYRANPGK